MKGCITLSNGTSFEGDWLGEHHHCSGEVVFYTGMTGYEQVLTDPSYQGQIVVFSYPFIGNYGFHQKNMESERIQVAGVVMADCFSFNEKGNCKSLADFLEANHVPALTNVDTRSLIQQIRKKGSLPAVMHMPGFKPDSFSIDECWPNTVLTKTGSGNTHIVLIDFGYKKSIVDALVDEGCIVTVVPYDYELADIEKLHPDAFVFSNGSGDPMRFSSYFNSYKYIAVRYPVLGICLGHQILALVFGGETKKLKFGHRGANHPVMNLKTGKVSMSSQNHSYVVKKESLTDTGFNIWFENVNDQSVEGLWHSHYEISSVQFHPEAAPGPKEHGEIFQEFINSVKHKEKVRSYA
ncbi:carbamoyl phosphate synthase small subunit [Fictibacillus barbaricus]|uniref:Carbamoyl phosphate synthase small chain n=1 Tax=Fictibacillus barbaricus TaxID=182136 RepID=A0ABS2ZID7_9BACL|nr:carbamoyl phosphate synthase small subunit [Fictibacillus barbaricus]MBN3547093.1 carbamoyl phosphate synthase small subunit [Fictibacillus barbaricus]GGB46385.1 carbamoyl-phosphate synthase arginine-specific small chain [Fictibacillus barbaricus]